MINDGFGVFLSLCPFGEKLKRQVGKVGSRGIILGGNCMVVMQLCSKIRNGGGAAAMLLRNWRDINQDGI